MNPSVLIVIGIAVMLMLSFTVVLFVLLYQQRVLKTNLTLKQKDEEKQIEVSLAMIRGEEEERIRIATELHDDVISSLLSTQLSIYNLNRENEDFEQARIAQQSLKEAIGKVRNISHKLHPSLITTQGFHKAMYAFVDSLNSTGHLNIHYATNTTIRPNKSTELPLFRIVQELVNNIIKHSKADFIDINLELDFNVFYLLVTHNGTGITDELFNNQRENGSSIGLNNIYNRITLIKGDISFSVKEDGSYQIKVSVKI